jgi:ketosteroid isomerase-like protein
MRPGLLAATASVLLLMGSGAQAATQKCGTKASDDADVAAMVKSFFAAIERADLAAAAAMTTPGFHAFDVAKAFTGQELFAMVGGAQKKGATLTFGIDTVETHVACNTAWAVWKNDGKINATPTLWLESAVLSRTPAGWRFEFYHSTKVPPAQ